MPVDDLFSVVNSIAIIEFNLKEQGTEFPYVPIMAKVSNLLQPTVDLGSDLSCLSVVPNRILFEFKKETIAICTLFRAKCQTSFVRPQLIDIRRFCARVVYIQVVGDSLYIKPCLANRDLQPR